MLAIDVIQELLQDVTQEPIEAMYYVYTTVRFTRTMPKVLLYYSVLGNALSGIPAQWQEVAY